MSRRIVLALLAAAMLPGLACAGSGADPGSAAAPGVSIETGTVPEVVGLRGTIPPATPQPTTRRSTTTAPALAGGGDEIVVEVPDLRADVDGLKDEESCWYRSSLVIGPADVTFENPELQKLTAAHLGDLGYGDSRAEIDDLLEVVDVYRIPADIDPLQAAANMGHGAAPVLMAGYSSHWGYAPGAEPEDGVTGPAGPLDPRDLFRSVTGKPSTLVGVIDTGFVDLGRRTPWPLGRIVPATPRDLEPGGGAVSADLAGHGIFVASTILQRQTGAKVVVARAGQTPLDAFKPDPTWVRVGFWNDHIHLTDGTTTDELQMFFAVQRLIDAGTNQSLPYSALNVSMGTYVCSQLSHSGLAVRAAMDAWSDAEPDAPVVAAAGNHPVDERDPGLDFLPADLDLDPRTALDDLPAGTTDDFDLAGLRLVAVAALDYKGGDLAPFSNHKPHDDFAIGTDILAVRRPGGVTSWSGSSFATAIATGALVSGESPDPKRVWAIGAVNQKP